MADANPAHRPETLLEVMGAWAVTPCFRQLRVATYLRNVLGTVVFLLQIYNLFALHLPLLWGGSLESKAMPHKISHW